MRRTIAMFWCKRFCCFFFSSYFGDGYLFTPPTECSILLDAFADYASSFTRCSIKHARPIRLCEECIDHYVNFSAKYKELLTTEVNGTSCKSIFISHDRLDAVLDYHDNILLVWDKGNCNGSYNIFYKALFLYLLMSFLFESSSTCPTADNARPILTRQQNGHKPGTVSFCVTCYVFPKLSPNLNHILFGTQH